MKKWFMGLIILAVISQNTFTKTVRYELTISKDPVNLSGKKTVDWALKVNGQIPAPTLEFNEGDDAEILVKNELENEETSTHWHGILLPPEEDGVSYVNTPPIFPGQSHLFKFKIRQNGTYWYHSHTMLQEQKGVYGAIVIHPKKKLIKADKELVVVLSDWSDENPDQILRNLRKDGDFYLYKKQTVRSISGAFRSGALKPYLSNEWQRMGGMDLSDVGYDAFLINGKRNSQLLSALPGERIRVRIINAGASSYFYVSLGDQPMTVISADGIDIEPIETKTLLMGMAETYDILFTVPEKKNYELRATVQDVTGFASGWIGSGEKELAPDQPQPDLYASMDHGAHANHQMMNHEEMNHDDMNHEGMNHDESPTTLSVDNLKATSSTETPTYNRLIELDLVLGGDMERYIWHINGKSINQDQYIFINEGDLVRFTLKNATMMHHPMHLHGHFFRVLNQFDEKSPLKHTVDVPPHGERTIEFYANEPGQWMLHCHNLYHMKTGMARIVKYATYSPPLEIAHHAKHDPHLHDHLYPYGSLELATNHIKANAKLMRTWDEVALRLESNDDTPQSFSINGKWDLEGDLVYRRWFGNFFHVIAGGAVYKEKGHAIAGAGYIWPMLIETHALLNHSGQFRLDVEKRLQWTSTVFTDIEFVWRPAWGGDHDKEYEISLMYGPSWYWAAGLKLTNDSLGAGVQWRF